MKLFAQFAVRSVVKPFSQEEYATNRAQYILMRLPLHRWFFGLVDGGIAGKKRAENVAFRIHVATNS